MAPETKRIPIPLPANRYTLEIEGDTSSRVSVVKMSGAGLKAAHGMVFYQGENGDPVRRSSFNQIRQDVLNVSIAIGEAAEPWLKWLSSALAGKATTKNLLIRLGNTDAPLLEWSLEGVFPVSFTLDNTGYAYNYEMQITIMLSIRDSHITQAD